MFLIGNSATLLRSRQGNPVWQPILDELSSAGRVMKGLPTTCQLHPNDEPVLLCVPDDFRHHRPNGGCHRQCAYRLSCGHACPLKCHPTDRDHKIAQGNCCEPCKRFPPECKRLHPCTKLCKDSCGPCKAIVGPVPLMCGHQANTATCHEVRSQAAIDQFSLKCSERVMHKFICGHEESTTCANSRSSDPKCPASCGAIAACGHLCDNR